MSDLSTTETYIYATRFPLLEMRLVYDLVVRKDSESDRFALLLFLWGMNPLSLYSHAVKKLFFAFRDSFSKSDFYLSVHGCCPKGFEHYKFCQIIVFLYLMDPRIADLKVSELLTDEEKINFVKELHLLQMILTEKTYSVLPSLYCYIGMSFSRIAAQEI